MRCKSCGEFIYKSKKFNARKENTDEYYLSIRILRFYIRCPKCASEITFKTDPQNTDYQVEHGATRNYEPWKEEREEEFRKKRSREEEEKVNPLKALENKTLDSKREVEIFEALDEIRALNDRNYRLHPDTVLHLLQEEEGEVGEEEGENEEEENFEKIQQEFLQKQQQKDEHVDAETNSFIKGLFCGKSKEKLDGKCEDGVNSSNEPSKQETLPPVSHGLLTGKSSSSRNSTTTGFVIPGIVVKKRQQSSKPNE